MGEYELKGGMALLAGVLFGLAIAEVAISVGKTSDLALAITAAVSAFAGITWAAYIDAGDGIGRIATMRWLGSLCAAAAAGFWVRSFGSRAVSSPPVEESA